MEGGPASANSSVDASHVKSLMEVGYDTSSSTWDASASGDIYSWAPPAPGTSTCLDNEDIAEGVEGKPIPVPLSTGWAHRALLP